MIGTKIRTIREEKKIKQLDIAVRLGIEQSTYAKIENGQIKITVERLFILAKILDVPITYFFEDIGVNEKNNEGIDISIHILILSFRCEPAQ